MEQFEIQKRALTDQEIDLVVEEIKKTPNITGYTKKEWQKFADIFVAQKSGELAGICLVKKINKQWSELAVLFVLPKFRHLGLGRKLHFKAMEYLQNKNIYAVTRNEATIDFLKHDHFELLNFSQLPFFLKLRVFIYALSFYRIKEYVRKTRVFKNTQKWFYAIKRTL